MKKEEKVEKKLNVIPISGIAKKRIAKIAQEIKGKDLFPEKTELAEKTLHYVNSLPM